MRKFLVVALLIGLFGFIVAPAQAGAIHQNLNFGGFYVSFGGDDEADGDSIWLNARLGSSVHRVDEVYASFYPRPELGDEFWNWSVNVGGVKNTAINQINFYSCSNMSAGGVSTSQCIGMSSAFGENNGYGNLWVLPGTIDWGNFWYQEFYDDYNHVTRFAGTFQFQGTFGAGEAGAALGRAYFGTPEPATLWLLGLVQLTRVWRRLRR